MTLTGQWGCSYQGPNDVSAHLEFNAEEGVAYFEEDSEHVMETVRSRDKGTYVVDGDLNVALTLVATVTDVDHITTKNGARSCNTVTTETPLPEGPKVLTFKMVKTGDGEYDWNAEGQVAGQ